jgi:hypothetical protein
LFRRLRPPRRDDQATVPLGNEIALEYLAADQGNLMTTIDLHLTGGRESVLPNSLGIIECFSQRELFDRWRHPFAQFRWWLGSG